MSIVMFDENTEAAATLRVIASRARRVPTPDHPNPHAFHEVCSELAADIVRVALTMRSVIRSSSP